MFASSKPRSLTAAAFAAFSLTVAAVWFPPKQFFAASLAEYSAIMQYQQQDRVQVLADMTGQDWVDVFTILGYHDTYLIGTNTLNLKVPDRMTGNHIEGVVPYSVVIGTVQGNTFSLNACYDAYNSVPRTTALTFVNQWNEQYRLSTSYTKTEDYSVCIQSDLQITKYAKANMYLITEFAKTFLASNSIFHKKWADLYQKYV